MNSTLSMVRSARFPKPAPLLATSPSDGLTLMWRLSIAGDIIRVQPNLVRRWKLVDPRDVLI